MTTVITDLTNTTSLNNSDLLLTRQAGIDKNVTVETLWKGQDLANVKGTINGNTISNVNDYFDNLNVADYAKFKTVNYNLGDVVNIRNRDSAEGGGGGSFLIANAADFASEIAKDVSEGIYVTTLGGLVGIRRLTGRANNRMFGAYPNKAATVAFDYWQNLQSMVDSYSSCRIEKGVFHVTRGIRQPENSDVECAGMDLTIIRAISPTGDGKFTPVSPSQALVWAEGAEGAPIYNIKFSNATLDSNQLTVDEPPSFPTVYLKGIHHRWVWNFEVTNVKSTECGSYAFWASDKTVEDGGFTHSSGVYNDCVAVDAEISFETTNVRGVTYNRCHAVEEAAPGSKPWPMQEQFHPYGGDDMRVVYNDCTGIRTCSTIIGPLLRCKNITFNRGYYKQLDPLTTTINMGNPGSDFDGWNFNDCIMEAAGSLGAVSIGLIGGVNNKITFKGGRYEGLEGTGLTLTSTTPNGGFIDIESVNLRSTTSGGAVPFALIVSGTFANFSVLGGSCEAYGPSVGPSPVNAPSAKFTQTKFVPASSTTNEILQSKNATAAFVNGGGFAQINLGMPLNITDINKVVVTGSVVSSTTDAPGAALATPISFSNPGTNIINILADVAAVGRSFSYNITEYV